ncbi:MAG TPA: hypothetical protein VFD98_09040 [Terracidiphilus sp.]|jgi:hypothetical protein|nr:hypothetical protein [Terracidiphilus sp.]
MKKKTIHIGDQQFTIAELNLAQVDELIAAQKNGNGAGDLQRQAWHTVLLSLNNAEQPPTREHPLGTDQAPHSYDSLAPAVGFDSFRELFEEVLFLSGLKKAEPVRIDRA